MKLLSEDDLNLKDMTPEELDRAWDLWFDLAQETNDFDPPYTHGVFAGLGRVQDGSTESTTHRTADGENSAQEVLRHLALAATCTRRTS